MFQLIPQLPPIALLFLIAVSIYMVVKGAEYFVKGAGSVSRKFGISTFVIGLTVVAIGTSAPEMFVNIIAAKSGATGLSIGNILGSNIANILLALGISAMVAPLAIKSQTVWKEFPYSLLAGVMVFILGGDLLINKMGENIITRSDGLALLAFFAIFLVYTFGLSKMKDDTEAEEQMEVFSWFLSLVYMAVGLVGLVLGGKLVVESATAVATIMGFSQNLIGLTVVAVGTSLPEIVTSVVAVRRGFVDMVVGGVVGSNIFNIFLVLGLTAFVAPLPFTQANITDAFFLMSISMVLFIAMFVGRKQTLERWQGAVFVFTYVAYIAFAVLRG
jgi:cation:H+ antiporter